jgi:hypothetical protein
MNVQQLVNDATSDLLLVPLWQANLDLSDVLATGRREQWVEGGQTGDLLVFMFYGKKMRACPVCSLTAFTSTIRQKLTHSNPKVWHYSLSRQNLLYECHCTLSSSTYEPCRSLF